MIYLTDKMNDPYRSGTLFNKQPYGKVLQSAEAARLPSEMIGLCWNLTGRSPAPDKWINAHLRRYIAWLRDFERSGCMTSNIFVNGGPEPFSLVEAVTYTQWIWVNGSVSKTIAKHNKLQIMCIILVVGAPMGGVDVYGVGGGILHWSEQSTKCNHRDG